MPEPSSAAEENLELIKAWEEASLLRRSRLEHLSDWITLTAASGLSLLLHFCWFGTWIILNLGWVPGVTPFDPFPFHLLATTVALEAIFLTLFVLASQSRLARQSEKRAHLNLQINLLSEREMTTVLQLLRDIALHLKAPTTTKPAHLQDLISKTDVKDLADRLDELVEGDNGT